MEMLQVADAVAREKNIEREIVLSAMEEAIQKAGRSKYGHDHDIRATINRKTGEIDLKRYREVVEEISEEEEEEIRQLTLEQAQREKKDAKIGDFLIDELPPLDFVTLNPLHPASIIFCISKDRYSGSISMASYVPEILFCSNQY